MSDIARIFELQKQNHPAVRATTARERTRKLQKLLDQIFALRTEIYRAVNADLRKSEEESGITEIFPAVAELKHAIRHLKTWMKPQPVPNPIAYFGSRAEIRYEPRGVVLVIAPWNYPFQLTIGPVVSAVAAGNCVMVKPSEVSANTSHIIRQIIRNVFPENEVAVFEGDQTVATELLSLPFDHIFFTGNPAIGKIVMQAASKHLTSVTLELGGKSPAIVDESADISAAAKKILWGKVVNAGQTCVAPDYALVPKDKMESFVAETRRWIAHFYGEPERTPDFCRIINERHQARVRRLIEDATARGAKAVIGGSWKDEDKYIAPTVLVDVPADSAIWQEEIFGPVLPVRSYSNLEEAADFINSKPKPLSLYIFSTNRKSTEFLLNHTTAGGTCINDVALQFANVELPFGGVNNSGIGNSHGFYGFRAFSHERAVLRQPKFSTMEFLYPPYTARVRKMIDWTIRYFS